VSLKKSILNWWNGEYTAWENKPGSGVFFAGGHTKHHWTTKLARGLTAFVKKKWKWVIGTILAVLGITAAFLNVS